MCLLETFGCLARAKSALSRPPRRVTPPAGETAFWGWPKWPVLMGVVFRGLMWVKGW